MLRDVTPPAVADPDERRKLAHLLARSGIRPDERAEQLQGTLGLFLAEPADEQLQPLPRCHAHNLTATATGCGASHSQQAGCPSPTAVHGTRAGPAVSAATLGRQAGPKMASR